MKKTAILFFTLVLTMASFRSLGPAAWTVDPYHSQLGFSVSLFGISDLTGTFKIKESTITTSKEDFSDAVVSLVADINSIDTDNDDRDKHLRTADYFDAEKFPTTSFKSSSFVKISEGRYKITGELTMHGITKPASFEALVKLGSHPMDQKPIAGLKVTGIIKRSDYGIAGSTPASMLADEVALQANLQFAKN